MIMIMHGMMILLWAVECLREGQNETELTDSVILDISWTT